MKEIKIKTPAKINLTLEIIGKREDGFHELQSIMQTVNLYDYLTIKLNNSPIKNLSLFGNSTQIPYNENNIVYKAWALFNNAIGISTNIDVYIEKNIPVCAGLAGGSTNAAGFLFGINKLFNDVFSIKELHKMCEKLGSDLNFCLSGGTALCTGRGEKIEKLPTVERNLTLIKPKKLEISAKYAYQKFAQLPDEKKQHKNNSQKLKELLLNNTFDEKLICNSLETSVLNDFEELKCIKSNLPQSLMSGSGPTFYILNRQIPNGLFNKEFEIYNNLTCINTGAEIVH